MSDSRHQPHQQQCLRVSYRYCSEPNASTFNVVAEERRRAQLVARLAETGVEVVGREMGRLKAGGGEAAFLRNGHLAVLEVAVKYGLASLRVGIVLKQS